MNLLTKNFITEKREFSCHEHYKKFKRSMDISLIYEYCKFEIVFNDDFVEMIDLLNLSRVNMYE